MTRVALLTGAARGIGADLARDLTRRGWRVAGCYRSRDEHAEALRDEARAQGHHHLLSLSRCDLADGAARERWVRSTLDAEGRCDAVVHAAGPFLRGPLLEQSADAMLALYEVNVVALHSLVAAAAPAMRARSWGRIVSFGLASSRHASAPPTIAAYYCAKLAATAMVRALARELAPHGVTANVVSPGVLDTGGLPADEIERLRPTIPAGYVGAAADAVSAVQWLLSDESRYVTGTEVLVAGGWGL